VRIRAISNWLKNSHMILHYLLLVTAAGGGLLLTVACRPSCSMTIGAATPAPIAPYGPATWWEAARAAATPVHTISRRITDANRGAKAGSSGKCHGQPPRRRIAPVNSNASTAKPPKRPHNESPNMR
jgi:hypothetical protein